MSANLYSSLTIGGHHNVRAGTPTDSANKVTGIVFTLILVLQIVSQNSYNNTIVMIGNTKE